MSTTYEKGVELERLVAQLFSFKGYEVKHNVKFQGRSGVKHQIDVYAEYRAPLHTSRIIVECKAYDEPVDKDIVMKLIQEVQDIGVDRGILVTTSYFTSDAESTAKGYPIDLWEYNRLKELIGEIPELAEVLAPQENIFHISPRVELEKARRMVKGNVLGETVIYYPYYEVDAELLLHIKEGFFQKKTRESILNVKVLVGAYAGAIVNYNKKSGISVVMPLLASLKLSRDELEALKMLAKVGSLSVPALASQLSWSDAKARKALQGLTTRGLIGTTKIKRTTYYSLLKPKIENLRSLIEVPFMEGKPKEGTLIKPLQSQTDVKESLESLWNLKVTGRKLIYYPYYIAKISRKGVEEIKNHRPV
ncbi:restriction endonuclease [Candidatus Bathyarchaeota archaeon]|nr:restriction endonuclease [Candidatus Bathyarchaeota archaeon]